MAEYKSKYTGLQVDTAVGAVQDANNKLQNKLKAGQNITLTYNISDQTTTVSSTGGTVKVDDDSIVKNAEGEIQMKQEYIDYLDNVLYKQPQIVVFTVADRHGVNLPITNELGTVLQVGGVNHRETNIENIPSNNIFFYVNDSTEPTSLGTPSETLRYKGFSALVDISTTTKYTAKITDKKGTVIKKDAYLNFYRYTYTSISASPNAPTTGTKQSITTAFAINGADFKYNGGDYIFFYTDKAGATVQTNVLGQWADVTTEDLGTVTFTQANKTTFDYNVYRIGPFIAAGTAKYRI